MAVKSDRWIRQMALAGMIKPFSERVGGPGIISWGLQPAGYDIQLDPAIRVFDSNLSQKWLCEAKASEFRARPPPQERFVLEVR